MKKLSLILFALMVSLFASAQTIEKTYYFGQPNISQIQGYEQFIAHAFGQHCRLCLDSSLCRLRTPRVV